MKPEPHSRTYDPTPSPLWKAILTDEYEIADYIETFASDYVDNDLLVDYFRGTRAVLRLIPIDGLKPGDPDANLRDASKERRYAKLPSESMPPLVIRNREIEDGNHRFRVAQKRGEKALWCYAVEDRPHS